MKYRAGIALLLSFVAAALSLFTGAAAWAQQQLDGTDFVVGDIKLEGLQRISEGTVFNYFETKEDIALYFFGLEVDHAIAAVRKNPALKRAPLEEKLFALVENQLEFLAPHERFIGALAPNKSKSKRMMEPRIARRSRQGRSQHALAFGFSPRLAVEIGEIDRGRYVLGA